MPLYRTLLGAPILAQCSRVCVQTSAVGKGTLELRVAVRSTCPRLAAPHVRRSPNLSVVASHTSMVVDREVEISQNLFCLIFERKRMSYSCHTIVVQLSSVVVHQIRWYLLDSVFGCSLRIPIVSPMC